MITLIDQEAYHFTPPVFYEIASAFVKRERESVGRILKDTAGVPFREIFDGTGILFVQGRIERIDAPARTVMLDNRQELTADMVLIALGAQTHTFNVPGVTQAFGVKQFHEAAELRHHLVSLFLRHRSSSRTVQQRAFMVVVVGGGSAGVETAAEIALFLRKLSALHGVDPAIPRVVLYEAGETILREYPLPLRRAGLARLKALGVDVHTKAAVTCVRPGVCELAGEELMNTDTVVWLAGIRVHDVLLRSGLPVHPRGGLIVDSTLEVHGHRDIFAAGDCVYVADPATGQTVPDVVWGALQQGTIAAENILRRLRNEPLVSYLPHPRPTFATVGGKYALVHLPPFQFAGLFGWILKQCADLFYLFHILPNGLALRSWWRSMRVRVAND
jgi:NADH:quinone reductase (non-electrogenic)